MEKKSNEQNGTKLKLEIRNESFKNFVRAMVGALWASYREQQTEENVAGWCGREEKGCPATGLLNTVNVRPSEAVGIRSELHVFQRIQFFLLPFLDFRSASF